jgi:hypothetical protein
MRFYKYIHFLVGIMTVLHFAVTGALMKFNYFKLDEHDVSTRMMFRANHIYILFCGLLNLLTHYAGRNQRVRTVLTISSVLIIAGTIGLNISFYSDPLTRSLQRELTHFSIFACFGGTVLYLLYLQFNKHAAV